MPAQISHLSQCNHSMIRARRLLQDVQTTNFNFLVLAILIHPPIIHSLMSTHFCSRLTLVFHTLTYRSFTSCHIPSLVLHIVLLRNFFWEKYKRNNGELSRREVPANAIHFLRTGRNESSSPGSSWNTAEILPQFERPVIVVKGVRIDNVRLIPDHDGKV